jgi:hypothetical protein
VADDGSDELVRQTGFLQQFFAFDTVLVGPELEVEVVKQTHRRPEIRLVGKSFRSANQRMTPSRIRACFRWNSSLL